MQARELQQQSDHSPGVVRDEERLARVVLPEHLDRTTGGLKPTAFRIDDLMDPARGLSLVRMAHTTVDELGRHAARLMSRRPDRSAEGVVVAETASIRAIRDDNQHRALCVLDDGDVELQAHAIAIRSGEQDRLSLKKVREHLMNLFRPLLSIPDAFR